MDLVIDLTDDLKNNKFAEFLDKLYEDNYLENYVKKILEIEEVESDRPLYMSILLTDNEKIIHAVKNS